MLEFISESETPYTTAAYTAAVVLTVYCICKCFYNIYLHPLRKIPGPKLAAMGSLYEFYYDVVKDGTYLWEIQRMHQKYGKEGINHPPSAHLMRPELIAFLQVRLFVLIQESCIFMIHNTTPPFMLVELER